MSEHFLGLSIAPKSITVAEVFPNRSSKAIAHVEATEAYQNTFIALARKETLNLPQFNSGLQKSFKLVQAAVNTHFNQRVHIPVVSLPGTSHDRSINSPIREAMTSIGFGSPDELQTIEMAYAAHYAYGLGTTSGLGLEKQGVDWDMGVYEALLVDYNVDSLSFSLIDLAEHGCIVRAQVELTDLGEGNLTEDLSKNDAAQSPIAENSKSTTHNTLICQKLVEFLQQELLLSDSASNTGAAWKPLRSDIRAVILAGDASMEAFNNLRPILQDVFQFLPGQSWLKDTILPKDMAAVGAARRAMHLMQEPEDFDVHVQHLAHDHDEL